MDKILLRALRGDVTERVPFWFMRQAGRFLPEYREVRASVGGFLELCFNPEKAALVTLQPLKRFHMDGAILFSDILIVPYALGVDVTFAQGEGPVVEQVITKQRIDQLSLDEKKYAPIFETVRLVKKQLPEGATLIGFAGAPWTVACYMLQGPRHKRKEFEHAIAFAQNQPKLMQKLIETLTEATIRYLRHQIDAGAEAVQIFDSWAGLLSKEQFEQWVIPPTRNIVAALKESHPQIPIIGFARGAGQHLSAYASTGVDCVGVDQETSMQAAVAARASAKQAVQGNLDPELLAKDFNAALAQTKILLETTRDVPHVFNYGHGMLPTTPVEHVAQLCEFLKSYRR